MVENTRRHQRISQVSLPGHRLPLSLGQLFIRRSPPKYLLIHFHGPEWLAEQSAGPGVAVLSVQLGNGSSVYAAPFREPGSFRRLMEETKLSVPVLLTGWSAGYGAIREILKDRDAWTLVEGVALLDGLHTDYDPEGRPGPLRTGTLEPFLEFARAATAGRKRMLITHSEVFPGTFASTTETADWLLRELGLARRPVVEWGPLGMQRLSRAQAGGFRLEGYAGNSAPDHVDHLHALHDWLRQLKIR